MISADIKFIFFSLIFSGSPRPDVKWLNGNGKVIESKIQDTYLPTLNSKLLVRNLSREHQHGVFTCQTSNYPRRMVSTNITIELHCKYLFFYICLCFFIDVINGIDFNLNEAFEMDVWLFSLIILKWIYLYLIEVFNECFING